MIIDWNVNTVDQQENYYANFSTINYNSIISALIKTLHATARLKHVIQSLRKYLFDTLITADVIDVTYDKSIEFHPHGDKRWIDMKVLDNRLGQFQYQSILFTLATRNDPDHKILIDLRDILIGRLFDLTNSNNNKARIITLFDTSDPSNLVDVGDMWFVRMRQTGERRLKDQTNYLTIEADLYYESKF